MGALFKRKTLVEQLAKQAGWPISSHCGGHYTVLSADQGPARQVNVRYMESTGFLRFYADFPIRFSTERTPDGLYARVLLRSSSLGKCHWLLDIDYSCEAQPYLFAQWPAAVVTPKFFNAVCQEMVNELRAFHQELRDKFAYSVGSGAMPPVKPQAWLSAPPPGKGIRFME